MHVFEVNHFVEKWNKSLSTDLHTVINSPFKKITSKLKGVRYEVPPSKHTICIHTVCREGNGINYRISKFSCFRLEDTTWSGLHLCLKRQFLISNIKKYPIIFYIIWWPFRTKISLPPIMVMLKDADLVLHPQH